jgi:hypothetical protein
VGGSEGEWENGKRNERTGSQETRSSGCKYILIYKEAWQAKLGKYTCNQTNQTQECSALPTFINEENTLV